MKKIVIIFNLLLSVFITVAQYPDYSLYLENYDADTTNVLRPEIFNLHCGTNFTLKGDCFFHSNIEDDPYYIYAIAQPYHTDTTINLDGIVIYNDYLHYADSSYENGMYTCDPTTLYCEILDNKMNVLYHIRYDTINQNSPHSIVKHYGTVTFFALNFDTLISIKGDFFVVISYGKDYLNQNVFLGALMWQQHGGRLSVCDTNIYDYPLPLYQFKNDSNWYETGSRPNTTKIAYLTVYPRINYTGQVNHPNAELSKVDISSQTYVFPNPATNEVNINCGYKINSLELYDEQGKLLYTKEGVNSYNYTISLKDYSQGTYFIKILTQTGQTTKKIIKK